MKIKTKKQIFEFNDYFKTIIDFKEFIRNNIKFVNPDNIPNINEIYLKLIASNIESKNSILNWTILEAFDFKFSRPNNINFWLERGNTIEDFNNFVNKNGKQFINKLSNKNINFFKYGVFKYEYLGIPKCNLCKSELILRPNIGRYDIERCYNENCASYKNIEIDTIRQLAFIPLELFSSKNKRINISSKLYKEYWLLKGCSFTETLKNIKEIKEKIVNINKESYDYYKITTDMNDYEINSLSCFRIEFWINKGFTEEEAKSKISEMQKNNSDKFIKKRFENPNEYSATTHTQLAYWINKGYSNEEALKLRSERQSTFTLQKCIAKYGEEGGLKRFNKRQIKWLTNYKKTNFSKISQDLFWNILELYPEINNNKIYFATYKNGIKDTSGQNNEYRLSLADGVILPDFFDLSTKKIIEFDGVYYHRINPENALREEKRDKSIIESGYKVYHVNELEYKTNKEDVINKCINFLKTN